MKFNEDSRVKVPLLCHMTRLGYEYMSLKDVNYDREYNIFWDIFRNSVEKINKTYLSDQQFEDLKRKVKNMLQNEDLGESFYEELIYPTQFKLIDFDNIDNNSFHFVTELTFKNKEDEFRPDVVILINGLPLSFYEVKKPNNEGGIQKEFERMENNRLNKAHFHHFFNMIQVMMFSNNMEYDDESIEIQQGSFYSTPSGSKMFPNFFREEDEELLTFNMPLEEEKIKKILTDLNSLDLLEQAEFKTNLMCSQPALRMATSLLKKERLMFLLKYGITYVKKEKKVEKHIIRYPQLFAMNKTVNAIRNNAKRGIIWHTQGSGKTALTYFLTQYLKTTFQMQKQIPKFYFIVDRLDLLNQAKKEFESRGLSVQTVNSKEEFIKNIRSNEAIATAQSKKGEINVINIQKFSEEAVSIMSDYNINLQRVYFMDEVHRSYNPKGSFLKNLFSSDKNGIFIGLTGTPLLKKDYTSRDIFGDYVHTYFYDKSIADKYTLRIKCEPIKTVFRKKLEDVLDTEIKKGVLSKKDIYDSETYCEALAEFIETDFLQFRKSMRNNGIGAMVVSSSSDQARMLYKKLEKSTLNVALVLYDEGSKEHLKGLQEGFKEGEYDVVIVYNMLLTGFDAPRLKRMYLTRLVKQHNLLQTLTRVNRPYEKFNYGYVVDFADIGEEYRKTNQKYQQELIKEYNQINDFLGDIFVDEDELKEQYEKALPIINKYNLENLEILQKQMDLLEKNNVHELRRALQDYISAKRELELSNEDLLYENIDDSKFRLALRLIEKHIEAVNLRERVNNRKLVEDIIHLNQDVLEYAFVRELPFELAIKKEITGIIEEVRKKLRDNQNKKDDKYVLLSKELEGILARMQIEEDLKMDRYKLKNELNNLLMEIEKLKKENEKLLLLYNNEVNCIRIHKLLKEKNLEIQEKQLIKVILEANTKIKNLTEKNEHVLENRSFFENETKKYVKETFSIVPKKYWKEIVNVFVDCFYK